MREKTVIVVMSTSPARAAKQATSIIPIVVGGMADPVGDELVVSFDRPAGNITGTTFIGPELIAKRFGLLKDAISGLLASLHFGILLHTRNATMEGMLRETETAAQALSSAATSIIAALCRAQARRISRAANGFRKLKA